MERYVLLEQYFCGKKYSTNRYVYSIETPFKIGDLVKGEDYIGKIVKEVNKPNFVCKRTSLTDVEEARSLLRKWYSDNAHNYWCSVNNVDQNETNTFIENDSIKYSVTVLNNLLGVENNGNTI